MYYQGGRKPYLVTRSSTSNQFSNKVEFMVPITIGARFLYDMTREIINKLGDYCYKYGKDFAQTFDEWLDWMIDFFCLENVLEHDCDFTKITDEMRESNEVFFLCYSAIVQATAIQIDEKGWFDAFGTIYEEKVKTGYKASSMGQFFTPAGLCDALARIVADGSHGPFVYDPACGSARLPLAIWGQVDKNKFHYFVLGDLDPLSCKMSALNMMLHGCFGIVERRNALTMEFFNGYIINEANYPFPCAIPTIRKANEVECRKNLQLARSYAPKGANGIEEPAVKIEPPKEEKKEPITEASPMRQLSLFNLDDF